MRRIFHANRDVDSDAAPFACLLRRNRARGSKFPPPPPPPRSIKYLVTTIIDETSDEGLPKSSFGHSPTSLSFRLPCMTMIKHDKWIDSRHEAHFA